MHDSAVKSRAKFHSAVFKGWRITRTVHAHETGKERAYFCYQAHKQCDLFSARTRTSRQTPKNNIFLQSQNPNFSLKPKTGADWNPKKEIVIMVNKNGKILLKKIVKWAPKIGEIKPDTKKKHKIKSWNCWIKNQKSKSMTEEFGNFWISVGLQSDLPFGFFLRKLDTAYLFFSEEVFRFYGSTGLCKRVSFLLFYFFVRLLEEWKIQYSWKGFALQLKFKTHSKIKRKFECMKFSLLIVVR